MYFYCNYNYSTTLYNTADTLAKSHLLASAKREHGMMMRQQRIFSLGGLVSLTDGAANFFTERRGALIHLPVQADQDWWVSSRFVLERHPVSDQD